MKLIMKIMNLKNQNFELSAISPKEVPRENECVNLKVKLKIKRGFKKDGCFLIFCYYMSDDEIPAPPRLTRGVPIQSNLNNVDNFNGSLTNSTSFRSNGSSFIVPPNSENRTGSVTFGRSNRNTPFGSLNETRSVTNDEKKKSKKDKTNISSKKTSKRRIWAKI